VSDRRVSDSAGRLMVRYSRSLPALIGPRRHARVEAKARRLARALPRPIAGIAGRQPLQREHLAPGARPHRDAVGDRVRQQRLHRLAVESGFAHC
jgi:hypothetical protein